MYNNGDANFLKYFFSMRAYENNNKILPSCRSLKAEDICGAISVESFSVGTYIDFMVTN